MFEDQESSAMTAPRGRPKRSERDDKTVKIDRGVVEKAQLVALRRKVTLAELLSELLRPPDRKGISSGSEKPGI